MIDWNEIKQLLETVGSVAVLDQDGSKFIVLSHDNYLRLLDKDREETGVRLNFFPPGLKNGLSVQKTEAQETIEKLNQDIAILKEEVKRKELQEISLSEEEGSVID